MFEAAELGRKITKKEFNEAAPNLRTEMLELQQALRQADFPVVIVFAGVDGAGKGETANLLNEWMDPRWIRSRAYGEPSQEEGERPEYWRYWRDLPETGQFGIFLSSWYSRPLLDRVHGRTSQAVFDEKLDRISAFERTLADDGALILKFWMHLGKDVQKQRLKKLEKDPRQNWRVTKTDWKHYKLYDKFIAAAERTIMRTSTGSSPWMIVEGADPNYRSITVITIVRDAVRKHLKTREAENKVNAELRAEAAKKSRSRKKAEPAVHVEASGAAQPTILDRLDMNRTLETTAYKRGLEEAQARLNTLYRQAKGRQVSTIMVFEGWDAGGKGGALRRVSAAMDARDNTVIPIAAPTDEERAHHYLWRFWRHLPRAGRVTAFDRSWYGRVLVERVEGFATEKEWMRAYAEINDFEEQLVEHGAVLVKYWMHITKEEQLARFESRKVTPWKQWKLTDEDWRNRDKWDDYEAAVTDMVERTSTLLAPWTLVEGNDKRFARVKVIETLSNALEKRLAR